MVSTVAVSKDWKYTPDKQIQTNFVETISQHVFWGGDKEQGTE